MKDKIIARFRAKYAAVNLTKKRLEDIAAKLETKITDENEIDAKLDELNEVFPFAEVAKQDDRIVQLELKTKTPTPTPTPAPAPAPTDPAPAPAPTEEVPAWAKAIIDSNKAVIDQMASFNKEKTVTDRNSRLGEALKSVKPEFKAKALADLAKVSFESEEDFDTHLAAEVQFYTNLGLGNDTPKAAFGSAKLAETEVSPAVKSYIESQKAAQTKTA